MNTTDIDDVHFELNFELIKISCNIICLLWVIVVGQGGYQSFLIWVVRETSIYVYMNETHLGLGIFFTDSKSSSVWFHKLDRYPGR